MCPTRVAEWLRPRRNQDTNDRYMANIQRNGTFSVIPRIAAGEITPEKLIVLGEVAKKCQCSPSPGPTP